MLKIRACIANAQTFLAIQKESGSFDQYIWQFVRHEPILNRFSNLSQVANIRCHEQGPAEKRL